jgi:S-DNA-T family DNA segregation ATPase FtsK/SpoIIIE
MARSVNQPAPPSDPWDDLPVALARMVLATVKLAARTVWWSVLFPMFSLPVAASACAALYAHWWDGIVSALLFGTILVAWRFGHPSSYHRLVTGRLWKRRRYFRIYRRRWASVMALHGLTALLDGQVLVPPLKKIKVDFGRDLLTVQMLIGQTAADWSAQSEALAHAFGAGSVRITPATPGWIFITINHMDLLAAPVPLPIPDDVTDLNRVRVGLDEDGARWNIHLVGRHTLVAGATGSGKGSIVWSIIAGVAPAVRDGLVALWVIDPKGGMEFGRGEALFTRFSYDAAEQTLTLLQDAAWVLRLRANSLRGVTRQHVPTIEEPLVVLVIDEIASLTAYVADRKIKAEIEQLLGLILSQGRAVGVVVIACVQDPSKEVLSLRQLFPVRVGLRLSEASQVGMVLGPGARERGALCDQISDRLPGVGYVAEDGQTELKRVRAFCVDDAAIAALSDRYRRPVDDNGEDLPGPPVF